MSRPIEAHSKSELKRLTAQGANVKPLGTRPPVKQHTLWQLIDGEAPIFEFVHQYRHYEIYANGQWRVSHTPVGDHQPGIVVNRIGPVIDCLRQGTTEVKQ